MNRRPSAVARCRRAAALLLLIMVLTVGDHRPVQAQPPTPAQPQGNGGAVSTAAGSGLPAPVGAQPVSLTARERPIGEYLQELLAQVDVPVTVSPLVRGSVSGTFSGTVEAELRRQLRAFNLISYYDGAVLHLYAASEITTRSFPAASGQGARVLRAAQELGLTDARNTLRTTKDGALVATGTRRFIERIDDLARAQQIGSETTAPFGYRVFFLRYAWAQDTTVAFGGRQVLVPGVASLLRSLVLGGNNEQAGERLLRPTQPRLRGRGLGSIGAAAGGNANGTLGLPPGEDPALLVAATTSAQPLPVPPGPIGIVANPQLNAIIIRDSPERLATYEQLIAALDIEPQMLEVEATIIDINLDRMQELGINWRWINGRNEVLFGNGTSSDLNLRPGQTITPAANGLAISTIIGNTANFISRINALQSNGAARVVSRPQVITLSNVEAVLDDSQTFYVRVNGNQEVDLFNVSTGTTLRVTPHVFRDRGESRIKLLVNIEDGRLTDTQVDQIPVVARASVTTQALIFDGESLLLGGLTRETTSRTDSKVPLLGDVPVLGRLFRNTGDRNTRVERLFLIAPRLASMNRTNSATGGAPRAPSPGAIGPAAPDDLGLPSLPGAPRGPVRPPPPSPEPTPSDIYRGG